MKVNLNTILTDFEGAQLTYTSIEGIKTEQKKLTAKDAIVTAINSSYPNEQRTPDTILKIIGISNKIYLSPEDLELSDEEIAFIKERVMLSVQNDLWKPVVYKGIDELFRASDGGLN